MRSAKPAAVLLFPAGGAVLLFPAGAAALLSPAGAAALLSPAGAAGDPMSEAQLSMPVGWQI